MTVGRWSEPWWAERATGLDVLRVVPWGTHICHFYDTEQDLLDILVPYFHAGLCQHEYCMWIVSDPLDRDKAKAALAKSLNNLDQYLNSGQLEIIDVPTWYAAKGHFDPQRVLAGWLDKLVLARQRGFEGLRLSANALWLDKHQWQDFLEYESLIDDFISSRTILAICSYGLQECNASMLLEVMARHNYTLVRRAGAWQVVENSEYKHAREALWQSEQRFAAAFHTTNAGFLLIQASKGIVLDVNQAWLDMLGYRIHEVLGKRVQDLDFFAELVNYEAICTTLRKSIAFEIPEVQVTRKDGQQRVHSVYVHKVNMQSERCYLVTVLDITEILQARRDLEAALAREKQLADERDQARIQVVRLLAHEIRNPLTALKGFAQVIAVQTADAQTKELSNKLTKEVDRLSEMLSRVLDAFRMQAGNLPMEFSRVDLAKIVESAVEFHRLKATHLLELDLERPLWVEGDGPRLEGLVRNLLSNAEKYSAPGSVIKVRLVGLAESALLSVHDQGIGISAAEIDRIFEGFYRASNIAPDGPSGEGLGLLLCKHTVERHGGRIWVESEVGRGSTFYVELPLSAGER